MDRMLAARQTRKVLTVSIATPYVDLVPGSVGRVCGVWATVLILAVALNFEPLRFILVPLLLARPRPMAQLAAYLAGAISVNLGFGFLILFVFHKNPLGTDTSTGGKIQVGIGVLALAMGALLAVQARTSVCAPGAVPMGGTRTEKFAEFVRRFLRKGVSPWFSGLLGMSVGLPSVDYLAVLVLIGTSQKPPAEQAIALVVFVLLGGAVVTAPLIGYLISPAKTLERTDRFVKWSQSRSQMEYAGLLALVGLVLLGVGLARI